MSKKKKIIISAVCIGVLLIGLVVGIILANIKRYNLKYQDAFDFNNHTQMIEVNYDAQYNPQGITYNNGVKKFVTSGNKYGLFSYFENKIW